MNEEEIVYFPWMSLSHFHEIFVKISGESITFQIFFQVLFVSVIFKI